MLSARCFVSEGASQKELERSGQPDSQLSQKTTEVVTHMANVSGLFRVLQAHEQQDCAHDGHVCEPLPGPEDGM